MKFGQLIESNKRNNFLRKLCRKWGSETTSRPLFKKKKTFYEVNTSDCSLVSIYFDSPQLGIQYNKLYKTLGYWSRDVLNFSFLEKGLEVVSRPYFVYEFSTKMFLMFYSRNWPNFIVWLPLLLEILANLCIAIVCQPKIAIVWLDLSNQAVFIHEQKVKTKT